MDRLYCTVREIIADLEMDGYRDEAGLARTIEAASQYIEHHIGAFIPRRETLKFDGEGESDLMVPPLLSVVSVINGGTTLTASDYSLEPYGRHWPHGPYSEIEASERGSAGAWIDLELGVVIDGYWGMWDETSDLGITATLSSSSTTSLSVSNGSLISPGMVLLVESEQLLVQATGAATDSTANLSTTIAADDTELTVSDGTQIKVGEVIKIGFEQMLVLDIATNTVMVTRGYNGTVKAAHTAPADVYVYRTFTVARGVNGTTAAAHTSQELYQYRAPADVNYLCRQIASLMIKKKQTGYVGRAGNDELGTGFFVNEFPKNQIEAVKGNYFWGGR